MGNRATTFLDCVFGEELFKGLTWSGFTDPEITSTKKWPEHLHLEFQDPEIQKAFEECLKEAAEHLKNYNLEFSIQTPVNGTPTIQVSSK